MVADDVSGLGDGARAKRPNMKKVAFTPCLARTSSRRRVWGSLGPSSKVRASWREAAPAATNVLPKSCELGLTAP
jgi:hypothetical protein